MRRSLVLAAAFLCAAPAAFAALSPSQLTAAEKTTYDGLQNDPDAANSFLVTREYLRMCQKVLAHSMAAISLPAKTDDYDDQYLSAAEKLTVRKAVNMNVAAIINAQKQA